MQGRIIKVVSNDYTVLVNDNIFVCKARGKFRNLNIKPLVGDLVIINDNNYILEIKPRKNELIRPPICNIDQVLLVMSVKEPDFSTNLLDKLLTIIEFNNIKPIICFTKLDILDASQLKEFEKYIKYYKKIGYQIFNNEELDKLKKIFKNKITVLTGQSGAGKSTLMNNLEQKLNILTAPISKALGRGRHTTRHVELFEIYDGLVADTPGFSAITFKGMSKLDIRDNFADFNLYRDMCKYKDCLHHLEDNCIIKEKVKEQLILQSRYDNYLKFINEE